MGPRAHEESLPGSAIAQLILEARAGSREALGQLMAYSRQYLLLIANDELPTDLQAKGGPSDLVQETQMEAVRGFAAFRGNTAAELLGWLREILRHNLRDFSRRFYEVAKREAGREVPISPPLSGPSLAEQLQADQSSPSGLLEQREQEQLINDALLELTEEYRNVIIWHNRDGLSFEEISERLDRSVGAVRKLWSRAIRQLQQRIQARHDPG